MQKQNHHRFTHDINKDAKSTLTETAILPNTGSGMLP